VHKYVAGQRHSNGARQVVSDDADNMWDGWEFETTDRYQRTEGAIMTAMKTSNRMLSVRALGAALAAVFALLAAGCVPNNSGPGPAPNPPTTSTTTQSAPAPGVGVVAPVQTNV
jgi:hypothetical protein